LTPGAEHLKDDLVARLAAMPEPTRTDVEPHLRTCALCTTRVQEAERRLDITHPDASPSLDAPQPLPPSSSLPGEGALSSALRNESTGDPFLLPRGAVVGRYLLIEPVGRGGMGVVYAAYDPKLDRRVALKLLPAGHAPEEEPDARERLLREAQAMARVSHPNVTALHDFGTFGDQVFLAMELVEGVTLRLWLQTHKQRRWREVLKVMIQAGQGLAAAHAAGLVHRDFKPDNVLVGKDGRVRVTDFGLARLVRPLPRAPGGLPSASPLKTQDSRLRGPLSQSSARVGTPAYMAPEQHLGQAPDARSDQFAFCVALYHALYRKRPFDPRKLAAAVRARDGSAERVIHPLPLAPPLPVWIKHALQRGLSISPEARYPSMEALLLRLSRPPVVVRYAVATAFTLLTALSVALAVPFLRAHEENLCRDAERKLSGVWNDQVAARIQSAFLITGRPYADFSFRSVKLALDTYAHGWVEQRTAACQATRQKGQQPEALLALRNGCLDQRLRELEALTTALAQADAGVVDNAVNAAKGLSPLASCEDVSMLSAPLSLALDQEQAVSSLRDALSRARAQRLAGHSAEGLTTLEPALKRARGLGYPPLLGALLTEYGLQLRLSDRARESEQALLEAWEAAEAGHDDEVRALAAIALVQTVGYNLGRPEDGLRWGRMAAALLVRLNRPPALQVMLQNNLALAQYYAGHYAEARSAVEPALAFATDSERIHALDILGAALMAEGNYARAVLVAREAASLSERLHGPDHPTTANELNNLAYALFKSGDQAEALPQARHALAVAEKALGPHQLQVGVINDTVGGILIRLGRVSEALEYEKRALSLAERALGPKHEVLAAPLHNLGYAYLLQKDAKAALVYLERALELPSVPGDLRTDLRFHTAQALWQAGGDKARAKALATQAQQEYEHQRRRDAADAVARWRKAIRP